MASKELKNNQLNINERPRYFASQYLLEDDFELQQDYALDRLQRYTRSLHVSGIADGLIARKSNGTNSNLAVDISEGTAIDPQGRQIVLLVNRKVELNNDLDKPVTLDNGNYILYIGYDEEQSGSPDGSAATNTRILEKPKFKLSLSTTSDSSLSATSDDFIAIAKLTIQDRRIVDISSDSSVRKYTGLRLPSSSDNPPTLRSGGDRASNLAVLSGSLSVEGSLSVTGNVGIGTPNQNAGLDINRGTTNDIALALRSSGENWGSGLQLINTATNAKTYGLYSGSDSKLHITDVLASADRIVLDKDGKVGIGTTTPTEKLEISGGNLKVSDGNLKVSGDISANNATLTGNVGIGTATINAKLEINSGNTNNLALLLNSSGAGWGSGIRFKNTAANAKTYGIHSGNDGNWHFADVDGSVDRLVVDKDGKVGIGTLNPSYRLNVDPKGSGGILIGNPEANPGGYTGLLLSISAEKGGYGEIQAIQSSGESYGNLILNRQAAGNVGIGTATPNARLDIDTGATNKLALALRSSGTDWDLGWGSGLKLINTFINHETDLQTGKTYGIYSSYNGYLHFTDVTANADRLVVDLAGNVGIGTTTPGAKLEVKGSTNDDRAAGLNVIALNAKSLLYVRNDGKVGIGTSNPDKGLVEIKGEVIYDTTKPGAEDIGVLVDASNGRKSNGVLVAFASGRGRRLYSLYASSNIAAYEFDAVSDSRIKELKGRSNSQADLQTLLKLAITDYTFKDKIAHGDKQYKKVVGQQIAQVYPQAVSTHKDAVPDVFQVASTEGEWVSLPNHGLQVGERVKLIWEGKEASTHTIEAVTLDKFQVSINHSGEVFVYGREVDDFHVVDYEALSMLHISATQEIYKIITGLQAEIQQLKSRINENDRHHSENVFSIM